MKIFFDTNVYIAEALLGRSAAEMVDATVRIYTSDQSSLRIISLAEYHTLLERNGLL